MMMGKSQLRSPADIRVFVFILLQFGAAFTDGQLYANPVYAPIWSYATPPSHPNPQAKPPQQGGKQMATTAKPPPRNPALTINLSDFVLMFVFKIVIFIIGEYGYTLGLGTTGKRNVPNLNHFEDGHLFFTSQRELRWAVRFVSGEDQDLKCLYQLACQEPDTGTLYRKSAKMVVQVLSYLQRILKPATIQKFRTISQRLDESVMTGLLGKTCPENRNCSDET